MATGGVLGDDTRVGYSASSPVSWTKVPQLINVDFPGLTPDKVGNDVHGSGGFHRNMPGLFTVNDMVLTVSADMDEVTTPEYEELLAYLRSKTTIWWRIEVPADRALTKWKGFEFQGYVGGWVPGTPIDDRQTIEITVVFDGDSWTYYAADSSDIT